MVGGIELPPAAILIDEEGGSDVDITLSPEANRFLAEEIDRLRRTSFVCRFLAGRPSRGMVRDMFQVVVLENMPVMKSVRGLGKNFFHIELGNGSLAQPWVELKVLELKYGKVLLQPWSPGFNPIEELRKLNQLYYMKTKNCVRLHESFCRQSNHQTVQNTHAVIRGA